MSEEKEQKARKVARENFWPEHDIESYQCPDCGCGVETAETFEVHHIDGDPFNNSISNLVALCHWCHRIRHRTKATEARHLEMRQELNEIASETPQSGLTEFGP